MRDDRNAAQERAIFQAFDRRAEQAGIGAPPLGQFREPAGPGAVSLLTRCCGHRVTLSNVGASDRSDSSTGRMLNAAMRHCFTLLNRYSRIRNRCGARNPDFFVNLAKFGPGSLNGETPRALGDSVSEGGHGGWRAEALQ